MRGLLTGVCVLDRIPEKANWIKPEMIVMVQFLERTKDGSLRFPAFKGVVA
jgi:hypothetical protein